MSRILETRGSTTETSSAPLVSSETAVPRVAEHREQQQSVLLGERLPPGYGNVASAMAANFGNDVSEGPRLAAVKGVRRIAVPAAERAAGEPHEHCRQPHTARLPLEGVEDLSDAQRFAEDGRPGEAGGSSGFPHRIAGVWAPLGATLRTRAACVPCPRRRSQDTSQRETPVASARRLRHPARTAS